MKLSIKSCNKITLNRITTIGVVVGFIGTRFLENGNLLITNVIVLISALSFRAAAKISIWLINQVKK